MSACDEALDVLQIALARMRPSAGEPLRRAIEALSTADRVDLGEALAAEIREILVREFREIASDELRLIDREHREAGASRRRGHRR